ncbi:alpha/beta hydrolase [Prauserella endophytica]|uniref:Alpha/beta hydrolase n=1 Tax=Prauserella endophytica TaxID=1592324 RepID=A0ABY2S6U3_9PSEU|nr:alpha/beta hydrolase [Prauserella endophytica]TKG71312.1 alpha/beta hydrolase [Prauserella endophytica]
MRKASRAAAGVGTLLVGVALAGVPGTAAAQGQAKITWESCEQARVAQAPGTYSCATYRVPIDHDNAALGTMDLALMRREANKPDQKLGSLFLNPGGPGASGVTMPMSADQFFEPAVLDRFDIIGFDPRGVGDSTPLRCFTTSEDAEDVQARLVPVPSTRQEISDALSTYRDYGEFCQRNAGSLLEHMSTQDVARDLDVLRDAVGDEKLNYVGFSYGTLLGATYANLFPDRVRTMVLDGNVDPALRTSDGLRYDQQRAEGFEHALDAFLTECAKARTQCAFGEGNPRQKFDELLRGIRQQPVNLPDGSSVDLNSFISGIGGTLYSPSSFAGLAEDLQQLYGVVKPPPNTAPKVVNARDLGTLLNPKQKVHHDVRPESEYTSDDSYFAVNCADKPFGYPSGQLPEIAARWEKTAPAFGRFQAFADPAACPLWKGGKETYRGPWNAATENPVLVVGNYYDPATRYEFSKRMADELGYSRLLSVNAFGHCILGDSGGVDRAVSDYLVNLTVPPRGKVYQPDTRPFDAPQ